MPIIVAVARPRPQPAQVPGRHTLAAIASFTVGSLLSGLVLAWFVRRRS